MGLDIPMRFRKCLKWLLLIAFACGLLGLALEWYFSPTPLERTEIYRGVYLTVDDLPKSEHGGGKVMIVEVHWDTPGVRIANRPFDYRVHVRNPIDPHYRLQFADWALSRTAASVLINTTIYQPDNIYRSLPGMSVRSLDTLVVNGQASHIHPHSYLLYWDEEMRAHMLHRKPPDEESLAKAVMAIGLQGIQVDEGRPGYNALSGRDAVYSRTFVGIDPLRNILYLMAFENASGYLMIDRAVREGVIFGGQVDSGSSTHLLIGKGAMGVKPRTGIRNPRPLGPYLTVHADAITPNP